MLTVNAHVFSDSVFLHGSRCVGSNQCFFKHAEKKVVEVMKSNSCKNSNDIARQSTDIGHVCLGDTSVQILQKLGAFMTENRHEPESFPDRIIFASMFNYIAD